MCSQGVNIICDSRQHRYQFIDIQFIISNRDHHPNSAHELWVYGDQNMTSGKSLHTSEYEMEVQELWVHIYF